MSVSKEEILEAISNMSVVDVVALIESIEKKFNVSAFSGMQMSQKSIESETSNVVSEKTEFSVIMSSFGSNKISVIKVARKITGLGLKEAKTLVETNSAIIKDKVTKQEADSIKKELEDVGASIEVK